MSLPESDRDFLAERRIAHEIQPDGGMLCVVLSGWELPVGLSAPRVDVLLRLPGGYPDVPPDMWWLDPAIRRQDGTVIPATEVTEQYLGRTWQRWSRHFTGGQWQSGVDGLKSYLTLMRAEFEVAAKGQAA